MGCGERENHDHQKQPRDVPEPHDGSAGNSGAARVAKCKVDPNEEGKKMQKKKKTKLKILD
jgi:hypothetical protein